MPKLSRLDRLRLTFGLATGDIRDRLVGQICRMIDTDSFNEVEPFGELARHFGHDPSIQCFLLRSIDTIDARSTVELRLPQRTQYVIEETLNGLKENKYRDRVLVMMEKGLAQRWCDLLVLENRMRGNIEGAYAALRCHLTSDNRSLREAVAQTLEELNVPAWHISRACKGRQPKIISDII